MIHSDFTSQENGLKKKSAAANYGSWLMVQGEWLRGVCEEHMPLCGLEEDTYGSRFMVNGSWLRVTGNEYE